MERTWRIDFETYSKEADKIKKAKENVDRWANMSLDPNTSNEERMIRLMMNNDITKKNSEGSSYICISYMCRNDLPQEFVEDAIYINSGLALLGCWNEKVIDWVLDMYEKYVPKNSRSYGNALQDVLATYESGKFKEICPEYHKHLKNLIDRSEYYILRDKISNFKIEGTDPDEISKQIIEMKSIVDKYKKCEIRVTNRLDWELLNTFSYDSAFNSRFYRNNSKTAAVDNVEDFDE